MAEHKIEYKNKSHDNLIYFEQNPDGLANISVNIKAEFNENGHFKIEDEPVLKTFKAEKIKFEESEIFQEIENFEIETDKYYKSKYENLAKYKCSETDLKNLEKLIKSVEAEISYSNKNNLFTQFQEKLDLLDLKIKKLCVENNLKG